jgi:hypothetical protein
MMQKDESKPTAPVGKPSVVQDVQVGAAAPAAPAPKVEVVDNPVAAEERDKCLAIVATAFERARREPIAILAKKAFWQKMKDSMWQDISYP